MRGFNHLSFRVYPIPEYLLKRGGRNFIEVMVKDNGGPGGIYKGPIGITSRETAKEILKMTWPEEYKKEWGKTVETDDKKDILYDKLAKKYRDQEQLKDWDERAFLEAYGNRDENMNSEGNRINFFMKIIHRRKRMEELFLMFPIS